MFEHNFAQILLGAIGSLLAVGILTIIGYLRRIHKELKEMPRLKLSVSEPD